MNRTTSLIHRAATALLIAEIRLILYAADRALTLLERTTKK